MTEDQRSHANDEQTNAATPADTWLEVIVLLCEAADRGYRQTATDLGAHSTALAADIIAAEATALIPAEQAVRLDDVVLDESTTELDMAGLILAAEAATRRHPIEQLPRGASGVIVALCVLCGEVSRSRGWGPRDVRHGFSGLTWQ
ncbi:MAG: hypothetical protein ACOYBY_07780 [Dermatophilaceae bacterium]